MDDIMWPVSLLTTRQQSFGPTAPGTKAGQHMLKRTVELHQRGRKRYMAMKLLLWQRRPLLHDGPQTGTKREMDELCTKTPLPPSPPFSPHRGVPGLKYTNKVDNWAGLDISLELDATCAFQIRVGELLLLLLRLRTRYNLEIINIMSSLNNVLSINHLFEIA